MPAPLGPCSTCGQPSSKYKCPTCYSPTCSLPCSKTHRSVHTSGSNHRSTPPSASTLQQAKQKHEGYIPLKSYDAAQFLHDYRFLSQIGRHVSAAGKHLLDQGLLPQQVEALATAVNPEWQHPQGPNNTQGRGPAGPSYRPDFAKVRRMKARQALKEVVRQRRCKTMWLPEGMAREMENKTAYNERQKRIRWSCEMAWPCSKGKRVVYHDMPPNLPIELKLMAELEKLSLKSAPANWKRKEISGCSDTQSRPAEIIDPPTRNKRKRGRKGAPNAPTQSNAAAQPEQSGTSAGASEAVEPSTVDQDATRQSRTYWISDLTWEQHGLLQREATDKVAPSPIPQAYTELPDWITLAVQVHHTRLRNETTLRYLEWWQRKGKDEEEQQKTEANVPQEAQEEFAAQLSLPGNVPDVIGAPGPASYGSDRFPTVDNGSFQSLPQAASFLPPTLLAQLSAKLDASKAAATPAKPSASLAKPKDKQENTLALGYASSDSDEEEDQHDRSKAAPVTLRKDNCRLLYLLSRSADQGTDASDTAQTPRNRGNLGIEPLLRSLPPDHAVIEFPRIEIWNTEVLLRAQEAKENDGSAAAIQIVKWDVPPATEEEDLGAGQDAGSSQTLDKSSGASDLTSLGVPKTNAVNSAVAQASPLPEMGSKRSLAKGRENSSASSAKLVGLASYDSDSGEEEEGDDSVDDEQRVEKGKKLRVNNSEVRADQPNPARSELLLPHESDSSAASTTEAEQVPSSLAAMAQAFGFVQSNGQDQQEQLKGAQEPQFDEPHTAAGTLQDADEVDWDEM